MSALKKEKKKTSLASEDLYKYSSTTREKKIFSCCMKYLQYNISVTIFKINIDTPVVAFMYWTCTKSYQHNLSNKKKYGNH